MKKIKGPAVFLAQFVGEESPFNSLDGISKWASSLGYKGVQIPSWDKRLIDLSKASSGSFCLNTFFIYNLFLWDLATPIFIKSFPISSKIILLLIFLKISEK